MIQPSPGVPVPPTGPSCKKDPFPEPYTAVSNPPIVLPLLDAYIGTSVAANGPTVGGSVVDAKTAMGFGLVQVTAPPPFAPVTIQPPIGI